MNSVFFILELLCIFILEFTPVSYDVAFFNNLLSINNKLKPETPSQTQLKECLSYFKGKFLKLPLERIEAIQKTVENAIITIVKLNEKKEAALMFELQNNRGLSLTNMEKLKSYLMYQMYIISEADKTEANIREIAEQFKEIYRSINLCPIEEDAVLRAHCQVYINGFSYSGLDDMKKHYKKQKDDSKIEWIIKFITDLHISFQKLIEFNEMSSKYRYARILKDNISSTMYPFIIKGFNHISKPDERDKLLHILEIVDFRYKLINSRANFTGRIDSILKKLEPDNLNSLAQAFKDKLNATWYWSDKRIADYAYNLEYPNKIVKYILWSYEEIELAGQPFRSIKSENLSIEHIYPQTPREGTPLATGYDISKVKESEKDSYIHCLGNLLLIDLKLNTSVGNKPYQEKLKSYDTGYNKSPILQQQIRVKQYGKDDIWMDKSIDERHDDLVAFITTQWSFDSILNE